MERVNFNYSLKNTPIPNNKSYLKTMIDKVEKFIRRMRWEAHFFESYNDENSQVTTSNFGFKSQATPPQNKHLNAFEDDMYEMIRSIEFRNSSDDFKNS